MSCLTINNSYLVSTNSSMGEGQGLWVHTHTCIYAYYIDAYMHKLSFILFVFITFQNWQINHNCSHVLVSRISRRVEKQHLIRTYC